MNLNQLRYYRSDVIKSVLAWNVFWIKKAVILTTILHSSRLAIIVIFISSVWFL